MPQTALRLARAIPAPILDRKLLETAPEQLHAFVRLAFDQVEKRTSFIDGRVVHVLCEYLQAVTDGEIKRIVINVPPGFMKSLLVCVFWPVWEWIHNPGVRTIYASYDPSLTLRDARRSFELLDSQWFVERWGRILVSGRQAYGDYWTADGGNRFSTSIKGKATGRHFHKHVADDPIKPRDAHGGAKFSEASLDEVNQWWDQTISTRTIDWKNLIRVIVMQRLHTKDLAGHALASGDYVHVFLPMHANPQVQCPVAIPHRCNADWRTEDGELLWPERCDEKEVQQLEKDLGSEAATSSQLEQRPTPKGGLVFNADTFRFYHTNGAKVIDLNGKPCLPPPHPDGGVYFQSWDLAFKSHAGSHPISGGVWQGVGPNLYLRWAMAERKSFTDTCKTILTTCSDWPKAHRKLIEDKANGPACEDVLKNQIGGIKLVEPKGGKLVRANAVTAYFESGNVIFPHPSEAPYLPEAMKQLTRFPFYTEDDFVDMLTQAVSNYFENQNRYWDALGGKFT